VPPERAADRWRRLAAADLQAAELLLHASAPPVPYHLVCFLAQQGAEKFLKGWIALRGAKAPRTHDLEKLVRRAMEMEPAFERLRSIAAHLTDFAVAPRYPGEAPDPGAPEASLALERAHAVKDFIDRLGPSPPQQGLPLD
jgi:HEPN domain-containing protein